MVKWDTLSRCMRRGGEEPEEEAADDPDLDSGDLFRVLAITLYVLDIKYSIELFSFTKI